MIPSTQLFNVGYTLFSKIKRTVCYVVVLMASLIIFIGNKHNGMQKPAFVSRFIYLPKCYQLNM
jgi:hypothetical protein